MSAAPSDLPVRPVTVMSELVYPLSSAYVADWDTPRAVAELIANAFDEDPAAKVSWERDRCVITDRAGGWPEEALVLGYSNKDGSQVGQFGEGAKIAMLVLAREHGDQAVKVATVGFTIVPRIERRRLGLVTGGGDGLNLLVVTVSPNRRRVGTRVEVCCTRAEYALAVGRFRRLRSRAYRPPGYSGTVVGSETGRMYIGGVLVAERPELVLAYDFHLERAKHLQNRDRSVLDGWEVGNLISSALAYCSDVGALERLTRAALAGEVSDLEQRFPGRSEIPAVRRAWSSVRRRVFDREQVFWVPAGASDEAVLSLQDRGWRQVTTPMSVSATTNLMSALGVPDVATAAGVKQGATIWVPRRAWPADTRANLAFWTRRCRALWGRDTVGSVRVFSATSAGCDHWQGFYDPQTGVIAIHADVAKDERALGAVFVHEVAHRRAHRAGQDHEDRSRGFEAMLSEMVADAVVRRRERPSR